MNPKLAHQEQNHIDQWWVDTGHNLTQKQAVDAAFALGLKYAAQFATNTSAAVNPVAGFGSPEIEARKRSSQS